MSCKKHPKYKALRPPVVNCDDCWGLWEEKHPGQKIARVPKKKIAHKKKCKCGE